MADTKDVVISSIHSDPNFSVICSFLTNYGVLLGLADISFEQLEKWIDDTRYGNTSLDVVRCKRGVAKRRFVIYAQSTKVGCSNLGVMIISGLCNMECDKYQKLKYEMRVTESFRILDVDFPVPSFRG